MKKSLVLGLSLISAAILCQPVFAFQYDGVIETSIPLAHTNGKLGATTKNIVLMKVKLSEKEKRSLQQSMKEDDSSLLQEEQGSKLPKQFDVGMNGTPVLDQGRHGSCVTFATTAAVDALIGKGDYISQLCQLELGSYLEAHGYYPSGWNGSIGSIVLHQMSQFGIVSKEKQNNQICAGVKDYPLKDMSNQGVPMSLDDYKQQSEQLHIYVEPIVTPIMLFMPHNTKVMKTKLLEVKQALIDNQETPTRVTFAMLLDANQGHAGACASYHANQDTWAFTDKIKNDPAPTIAGHEMVITGYDDNAVVKDDEGKVHKGLFTLRNSWSDAAGYHGNYYMTYDYFTHFVDEAQEIVYENDDN